MRWHDLGAALALMLVLEGVFPFLNPAALRQVLQAVAGLPDRYLRIAGLASMLIGVGLLYFLNAILTPDSP
jgi:uncharacterized protein YjeT (DUF2065 family)